MKSEAREETMRLILSMLFAAGFAARAGAQTGSGMPDLAQQQKYTWPQASSTDLTGANSDSRAVNPGILTVSVAWEDPELKPAQPLFDTLGRSEPPQEMKKPLQ